MPLPSAPPVRPAPTRKCRYAPRIAASLVMGAVTIWVLVATFTSHDAQAGIGLVYLPLAAIPLATAVFVAERVLAKGAPPLANPAPVARAPRPVTHAALADRLAALVIDLVGLGALLILPDRLLGEARLDVIAVAVSMAVSVLYFSVCTSYLGATAGQAALGLSVVDARTGGRLPFARALIRGAILSAEVAACLTLIGAVPAIAELAAASRSCSVTDRLVGSTVVADRTAIR